MGYMHTAIIAAALAAAQPALAQQVEQAPIDPGSVAFLGITFLDTSTEGTFNGVRQDETDRIEMLDDTVRDRMAEEGFDLVDTAPVAATLNATSNVADCNACDVAMARTLGADYALVGQVQKVSNLILSIKLVLRDAATGDMVRGQSVDIRSNTDESWMRGIRYIFENNFFRT